MILRGQMLSHKRAGHARSNDENLTTKIPVNGWPWGLRKPVAPGWRATAQVILPNSFRIEHHLFQSWLGKHPRAQSMMTLE